MSNGFKIYWTFLKSFFSCQHFSSDLTVNKLIKKIKGTDDGEYFDPTEEWLASCTCKCGKINIEQKFAFGTTYLTEAFDHNGYRIKEKS